MSMFDFLQVDLALMPGRFKSPCDLFQTKSLDRLLDTFTTTVRGRLDLTEASTFHGVEVRVPEDMNFDMACWGSVNT